LIVLIIHARRIALPIKDRKTNAKQTGQ
jgi:hypothetical protein